MHVTETKITRRMRTFGLLFIAMWWIGPSAEAATKTWVGSTTNNAWSLGSNWTPAGMPGTSDDVVFDDTAVTNVADGSDGYPFVNSITFSRTGGATVFVDAYWKFGCTNYFVTTASTNTIPQPEHNFRAVVAPGGTLQTPPPSGGDQNSSYADISGGGRFRWSLQYCTPSVAIAAGTTVQIDAAAGVKLLDLKGGGTLVITNGISLRDTDLTDYTNTINVYNATAVTLETNSLVGGSFNLTGPTAQIWRNKGEFIWTNGTLTGTGFMHVAANGGYFSPPSTGTFCGCAITPGSTNTAGILEFYHTQVHFAPNAVSNNTITIKVVGTNGVQGTDYDWVHLTLGIADNLGGDVSSASSGVNRLADATLRVDLSKLPDDLILAGPYTVFSATNDLSASGFSSTNWVCGSGHVVYNANGTVQLTNLKVHLPRPQGSVCLFH